MIEDQYKYAGLTPSRWPKPYDSVSEHFQTGSCFIEQWPVYCKLDPSTCIQTQTIRLNLESCQVIVFPLFSGDISDPVYHSYVYCIASHLLLEGRGIIVSFWRLEFMVDFTY